MRIPAGIVSMDINDEQVTRWGYVVSSARRHEDSSEGRIEAGGIEPPRSADSVPAIRGCCSSPRERLRRARSGMGKKDGSALGGRWLTMRLSRRQERMSRSGAIIVAATLMIVPARAGADVSAQAIGDATQAVDDATQAVGNAVGDATQAVGDATQDATQAVGNAVGDATQAGGAATQDATQAVDGATQDATQVVGDAVDDATQAVGGAVGGATQAVGGAVGGATQAVGGAVGGATQAATGATQAVGSVVDGATQGASGAVGDGGSTGGRVDGAPGGQESDGRNDPAAMSRHPAAPRTPWPASHADVDRVFPTPQGEGVEEQGDPCVGDAGSVCLGLLYGIGGFEDGGAKVLGILVTTGAAVIVLMLICLGLGVTGSTLVVASRRSLARSPAS